MSSPSISERYGEDTRWIVDYLTTTARSYRFQPDWLDSAPTKVTGQRFLAKEDGEDHLQSKFAIKRLRKQGRKNSKEADYRELEPKPKKISVRNLIVLAKHVASHMSKTDAVPNSFFATIDRAIKLRTILHSIMKVRSAVQEPGEDKSHWFFIQVLEEVRLTLLVRKHLKNAWSLHRIGHADLSTCAVLTNVLTIYAKHLIHQVIEAFDNVPGGIIAVAKSILVSQNSQNHTSCKDQGIDAFSPKLYDRDHASEIGVAAILEAFLQEACHLGSPVRLRKDVEVSLCDLDSSGYDAMLPETRFTHDKAILHELLAESLKLIQGTGSTYLVESEMIRAVRELKATGTVSFFLVFVAQTHLDIHHCLGSKTWESMGKFDQEVSLLQLDFEGNPIRLEKRQLVKAWNSEREILFQQTRERVRFTSVYPNNRARKKPVAKSKRHAPPEENHLCRRLTLTSPNLAGLYLSEIRDATHGLAVAAANETGSFAYSIQLERISQALSHLDRWLFDIRYFLHIFGLSRFWIGNALGPSTEWLASFRLFHGDSPREVNRSNHGTGTARIPSAARTFARETPLSSTLARRFVPGVDLQWDQEGISQLMIAHADFQAIGKA